MLLSLPRARGLARQWSESESYPSEPQALPQFLVLSHIGALTHDQLRLVTRLLQLGKFKFDSDSEAQAAGLPQFLVLRVSHIGALLSSC